MFESGISSFYQQEMGIPEMKCIFDILQEYDGAYGARPSGAGFRGAVVVLVESSKKKQSKPELMQVIQFNSQPLKMSTK